MRYIHDTTDFYIEENPGTAQGTAITLGKFDGLHRGHQKLLHEILRLQKAGYYGIVFAIAPENRTVLFTPEEKRHMLEAQGIDCMIRCPFVPEILGMEPETFISEVLCRQLRAKQIVVGTDFRFGFQRSGDVATLKALQKKYGYTLTVVEKECYGDREISSTYIREALAGADMELVHDLMGDWYPVEGTILHGHQLGRTIGMPTINLRPDEYKLLPPPGVYYSDVEMMKQASNCMDESAVSAQLAAAERDGGDPFGKSEKPSIAAAQLCGEEPGRPAAESRLRKSGAIYHGITNIGYKPTVDGTFLGVETYLYGVHRNLYGRKVRVLLRSFRRPEQKFTSVEELKAQMERDILSGKEYFGGE
ncbi:MAG: bifunctional riboflavin kinase/FMN adenylyltransferase [Lachnospiraceae bacterium]|nr:bifunctional riboflavin kinase/FMN adenylyltransferase [Lachnospiraceae bacterium]